MIEKKCNYSTQKLLRFFLLFFILISSVGFSQKPLSRIITAEEFLFRGTNVNFAFDIVIDSNGYVFFTGSSGVVQFNGEKFEAYDPSYGFANLSFEKGFDGKLWMDARTKGVNYLDDRRIVNFPLPDSLMAAWGRGYQSIYQSSDKTVHISPLQRGYFTVDSTGEITNKSDKLSGYHGFFVQKIDDDKWIHYSILQPYKDSNVMSLYFVDDQENVHLITPLKDAQPVHESSLVMHADSSFSLSYGTKEIITFKGKKLLSKHLFKFVVIKLFVDSRDVLWVGTVDHGVFKVENFNYPEADQYWGGASAIVAEDVYGGLWFKSDTGNFGYITPIATPHYSKQSGYDGIDIVETVKAGNNELIIKNSIGEIYLLKEDSLSEIHFPEITHTEGKQKYYDWPLDFCFNPNDEKYWFAFYGFVLSWDGEIWNRIDLDTSLFHNLFPVNISVLPNGKIGGSTREELFTIEDNQMFPISEVSPRIYNFVSDSKNKIWVSKVDGLWVLDNNELVRPKDLVIPANYNTNIVLIFAFQDELWIQPYNRSLIRISENKTSFVNYRGSPLDLLNYTFDSSGNLWGISQETGSLMKIIKKGSDLEISSFGCDNFLRRSKHGESIVVRDEFIYNGTSLGLFKTSIKDLTPERRDPRIVFTEVRINAKTVEMKSDFDLSHTQNHINIAFDAISFRLIPLEFSHKMAGLDSIWIRDNYENVQYTNLAPGNYEFLVRARANKGDWSEPTSIHFNLAKPYWETWWFRITAILAIILFLYAVYRIRANKILKQERAKSKIALEVAQLELRALKAQINPHFIFNSITSVMFYLSQNKTEKAQSYLERFSKLIRKVLESSDQNMVSLVEEVELMRHYIFLESERFQGETIELNTSFRCFDPETVKIPPTLLQPYIENAIRHGLKLKKGKRSIALDFILNVDLINVTITDNGIGRESATEQDTRTNHKSFGMSISSRRIELLNKKSISQIKIEDLKNEREEALGTRISFNIPFVKQAKIA
ncbi:MAG: hypothetical protein ACI8ZM_004436 [Crocinitomix sp.]|jgi:hypothetical protein